MYKREQTEIEGAFDRLAKASRDVERAIRDFNEIWQELKGKVQLLHQTGLKDNERRG